MWQLPNTHHSKVNLKNVLTSNLHLYVASFPGSHQNSSLVQEQSYPFVSASQFTCYQLYRCGNFGGDINFRVGRLYMQGYAQTLSYLMTQKVSQSHKYIHVHVSQECLSVKANIFYPFSVWLQTQKWRSNLTEKLRLYYNQFVFQPRARLPLIFT